MGFREYRRLINLSVRAQSEGRAHAPMRAETGMGSACYMFANRVPPRRHEAGTECDAGLPETSIDGFVQQADPVGRCSIFGRRRSRPDTYDYGHVSQIRDEPTK